ncbi:ribosome biogenesis GTP-binding protein YsxC [Helicobacter sp. 11S02629-2]|nr:ribosome biogenesis GTP-binding protein YsxC [Helicobacter sp. 11S02629-2]
MQDSKFLRSATGISNAPEVAHTEIALLGRSNVGKSSLINSLLASNLAKKSNTPGKTRHINFYTTRWSLKDESDVRLDYNLNLLDLPGFGYAKVSKSEKEGWDKSLDNFLRKRSSIKLFCHLVDSRHPSLEQDLIIKRYLESLIRGDQKILTIYTKVDKLTKSDFLKLRRKLKEDEAFISNVKKDSILLESLCKKILSLALSLPSLSHPLNIE